MDYKYINQLLERYWQCETTLQEEAILRAFFSQDDVPESLMQYKALFSIQQEKEQVLGDDFDARILAMVGQQEPKQKARVVSFTHRLMPLFRAAAVVAIILTIGNAAQAPWDRGWDDPKDAYARFQELHQADSVNTLGTIQAENVTDTMKVATDAPTIVE
jgi:hypothetical protein